MPQTFGRYELREVLGRGGMGEVYRARDTVRQRDVALKVLPDHLATDEKFLARFRRESRLAAQLSDPHIIPIHDFGEIDGRLFIDMRLVLGSDLGSLIEDRGPLGVTVAVDIVGQVASALDAAHADALIHRDVKPGNVMLTGLTDDLEQRPPFAYLVDFGIARSTAQMTALTDTSSATIGTVAYMSPERINGDVGDGRGDVYALACMLFEVLVGEPPFVGDLVPMIYQHMNADPPRVSERAAVPTTFDDVIAQGLAKDPSERFATAGALALAARRALSDHPTTPVPAGSVAAPARPRPRPVTPTGRPRPSPTGQALPAEVGATRVGTGTWSDPAVAAPPERVEPERAEPETTAAAPPARSVTLLWAQADDPTRADEDELRRHLADVSAAHGGVLGATDRSSVLVVFDDPSAALSAAAEAQRPQRHDDAGPRARLRIAVHTGQPRRGGDGYWDGDVAYVARLAAAARGGQVLVAESARWAAPADDVESLGRVALDAFPTPREVFHLVVDGVRAGGFAPPRTPDVPRTNLPSVPGALVGRGSELDDLVRRLTGGQRLVTLTGAAGSGKTRLAVEAADVLTARFEAVSFVDLNVVTDAGAVAATIARTLGIPDREDTDDTDDTDGTDDIDVADRLGAVLRGRRVLLVLDGVDDVPDAGAAIGSLVSAGDSVHVLVTSAEPLRVAVEHVVALAPLELPVEPAFGTDVGRTVAQVMSAPSVQLLLDRAAAAGAADLVDVSVLGRLCRRLDGLPLALELVAARLTDTDPALVADGLGSGADGALEGALAWTVGLLAPFERRVLVLLAGFATSFSPMVAQTAFGDAVDELAALVAVGLVRAADDGRYVLRPSVRRYARRLGDGSGDLEAGLRGVAEALAANAEHVEALWPLREGNGRLSMVPEQPAVLVALDWARDHDATLHLRLATSTAWLLHRSGMGAVSRRHLRQALERAQDARATARCVEALAVVSPVDDDGSDAAARWRELADADREAMSLTLVSSRLAGRGADAGALAAADRIATLAAETSDPDGVAWLARLHRARALGIAGRHEEAGSLADTLLADTLRTPTAPDDMLRARALVVAAELAHGGGRGSAALARYGEAMLALERFDVALDELELAGRVGLVLLELDRHSEAVAALTIGESVHREWSWPMPAQVVAGLEQARTLAGPERSASARARAASYSTAEAMAWVGRLARGETEARTARS